MRNRLLFLVVCFLIIAVKGSAQLWVSGGTNAFLQGAYLEIGELPNGSFGVNSSPVPPAVPTVYHPHNSGTTWSPGVALAEVYDWGHDGWSVGAPSFMGDYTYPGSPFEGWEIQIGASRAQAFQGAGAGFFWGGGAAAGWATGSVSGYTNVGGSARSMWTGSASTGALQIYQETRVDTFASAVIVTTVMKNMSGSVVPSVYYMRSCDPDNDESWSGGGFPTNNTIVHQNEDPRHMVMVKALGQGYPVAAYLALATKDCRAKAFIYDSWSLGSGIDLGTTWTGTYSGATYNLGGTRNGDIAIGLTYNLGNIAAGDSAVISYAYVFNGDNGIDSAFPDPQIVINGSPHVSWAPPTPNYDTFNVCLYPGMTSFPVNIRYADDKCWTWSHWTWSPSLGLSATTGTSVVINSTVLPATITYTITGTDSATGMSSCNRKTFYLTVLTCNGATCNSPCVGDTLKFNAPGDSTLATYVWFGPAPSTSVFSTSQANFRFPAAMSDTGTYTVIKSVSGVPVDTATCHVTVHPLPVPTVISDQAYCQPMVSTLHVSVVTDSTCNSWTWTGPNGFTGTGSTTGITDTQTVYGFDSLDQGVYNVHVTSIYGCKNNGSIDVEAKPFTDFTFERHPGCPFDTLLILTNTTNNANIYSWDYGDGSTPDGNRLPPPHIYHGAHTNYSIKLSTNNLHCSDFKTATVDMTHAVTADFSAVKDTICNGTALMINDNSSASKYGSSVTPLYSHMWTFGDGTSDTTDGAPAPHTYAMEGIYTVTLLVTDSLQCQDKITKNMYVLQPYMRTVSPDTVFCLTQPLALYNTEWLIPDIHYTNRYYTYSWSPSTYLSDATIQTPLFNAVGSYTYVLTATLQPYGCTVQKNVTLNSIKPAQLQNLTISTTAKYGNSVYLNADSELNYTWTPDDGSLNNTNINNPIATPTVTTTYTVYGMDKYGCRDTAQITIRVDTTQTEIIPSAFTPNGDGLNDVFHIGGTKFQNLVEMRIFNRWGECVFSTRDKDKGWDGTYHGVPQDLGTYFYTIIVARPGYGDNIVYKGELTLIR